MSSNSGGMDKKIMDRSKWSHIRKLLISASDASFERSELPTLINAILTSEQEFQLCPENDTNFLTIIAVLSAHHITSGLENVSKVQLQNVTKACRILIQFLVLRLKHYDSSLGCSQKHVLMVLLGLCKGTGFLQSTDRKSLVNSNEFLQQSPQNVASDDIETKPSGRRGTQDPGALIVEQLMQPVYDASEEASGWDYTDREPEPQQLTPSALGDITAVFASKNVQFLMSLDAGTDVIDMCLKLPHIEAYLVMYLDAVVTGTLTLPSSTTRLSLQALLNDITIVHWALSLPILEPLDAERFRNLFTLSASCLVLSVVVTIAMGSQSSGSTSKAISGKDDDNDSQAIEIIRKCLEIFRLTCKATRNSTRAGGHHLQNCEMIGAWILLTGLQTILGKTPRTATLTQLQSPKDSQKPIGTSSTSASHTLKSKESLSAAASKQSLLRVQQSFSVLAVGLANQAVSLLTSLFRNVYTEPAATVAVSPAILDVLAEFQAQQRIQLIFNGINLNNLIFNMAAISYRKACSLRRCHEQPTNGEAGSSSDSNSYYDDDFSCSGDSSPEDDDDDSEPILGHWFEETITPVDSGRGELPQATSLGNGSTPYDTSHDSQPSNLRAELDFVPEKGTPSGFIRLATSVLTFANRYLICTDDGLVRDYTSSRLCEQHVIILAGLLRDVDREIMRSECEPGNTVVQLYSSFSVHLSKLMHNMITLELLSTDLQNLLLTQLGVNPWTGDDWPLQVNSRTLAVVAKVLLLLAQRDRSRFVDESDAACCTIWKRLLQTLQQSILNPVSSSSPASSFEGAEDLNVEHAQLLLFLLQSVPLTYKRMVLLDCANAIASVVNVVDTVMKEIQILHLVRLLLIFEYFLKHMYMAPSELIEQVRWNVFGELCTADSEDSDKKRDCKMYFPSKPATNGNEQADDRFYVLCPPFVIGNVVQKPDQLAVNALLSWTQISYAQFQRILMRFFCIGKQWDLRQRLPSEQLSPLAAQLIQCGMEVTWRILLTMPPAASFLENLHELSDPEHTQSETYVVPLASVWASRVAHKRVSTWLKESLVHQGLDGDKSDTLLSQVVDKCGKLEHDVSVAKSMFANLLTRYENLSPCALLVREEILQTFDVCMLDTVVAKLQMSLGEHIKKPSTEVEPQMKEIAEDFIPYVLKVIKLVRNIVRASLLYQASDKCEADSQLSNSSLRALSLVLELTSSRCPHTASLASSLTELLPATVRSVMKTWNSHALDDFPLMVDLRTDGAEDLAVCERYVIRVHHGHWQALASNPQHAANISLKHLLHSLSRFPAEMLVWLSEHKLSGSVVDSLFPLIIDGTTENIAQLVTLSVGQLVGTTESEEYLQRVYYHVIVIGYDLLINCTADCSGIDERIFHEVVKFLEAAMEKTAGRKAMETFFIDGKKDLSKLLLSIANGDTSPNYASKVLKFFNKLYQLAEKSPNDRILEALCASLSSLSAADPKILQLWLEKITCTAADAMKNLLSEESSLTTIQDNRQQLQILTSYFIKNNSIGEDLAHVLLDDLIPMATHVLSCLGQDGCSGFPDLLTVMSTLAGVGSSGRGHVKLFKVATIWLTTCKTYLLKNNAINELDDHLLLGSHHGMTEITCRILSCMADILGAMKVLSDRWDARTGITSPPHDTEFLPQDVDSDWAEEMGQDDDSAAEDSDEDSLSNKLCTFTLTQKEFMNQHWYHCHTCKMVDGVGVCTICAKVCHRDHDVTYAKYGSFFCDCGAKEDGSCQALVKRAALGNEPSTGPSIGSGGAQFATDLSLPSSLRRRLSSPAQIDRGSDPSTGRSAVDLATCRKKALLSNQLEAHCDSIIAHLMKEDVAGCVLDLLEKLKSAIEHHCMRNSPVGSIVHLRDSLRELHSKPMNFVQTDQLMVPTLGSQEGAFENVRLTLSGEQGQTIRQLLSAHVIHRVAMCLLAAPSGRRQHLAVSHEKGKITVLQLSTLLRQADSGKRKLTLTRLASAPVPFTVLSMAGNPCNDEVLAVCGLKECHVMTFNTSGTVSDHLVLHPQGAFGNFLIKAVWLPGSQTELALVMPDIVKIFDLSEDVVNPQYYFLLPESKIRDCCFVMTEDGSRYALLMCASGHIYMQQLCEESLAKHGPFYVTNVLEVEHPDLQDSNGQMCGGGVSVYYSHSLQLLFFSYSRGKTFVASLQKMKNELTDVHLITMKNNGTGKGNGQPLWQWTEVVGHPGLVCCLTQSTNNPVVLMVRPENIFVQEIKVQPAKAKITDMVALRHPVCGTEHRTTLILLCEDGSLRIYTANVDQTGFWLSPSHRVFAGSGSSTVRQPKKKKVAKTSRPSGTIAFPVDFFEHCQPMNDVEFGGNDLLQIYNVQQLKHRLNSAGMYVASSKAVGFTVEVTNPDSGIVITGVRVLLGGQDVQRVPSYIEIFSRSVQVALTRSRWYDFPLTREESLQAAKKLSIFFGTSAFSTGVTMVDSIKVYGKSKEVFGWPDDNEEFTAISPTAGPIPSVQNHEAEGQQVTTSQPLSLFDRILSSILQTLDGCFSVLGQRPNATFPRIAALDLVTGLLTLPMPPTVQQLVKVLLATMHPSRLAYHNHKDQALLGHVVTSLRATRASALKDVPQDPDAFYSLVAMARAVAVAHPWNLVRFAVCHSDNTRQGHHDDQNHLAGQLINAFWKLHSQQPTNVALAPVCKPALANVDLVVQALVEVVHTFAAVDLDDVPLIAKIYTSLLFAQDATVGFACKQVLIRLLRPRVRRRRVCIPSPPRCSTPGGSTGVVKRARRDATEMLMSLEDTILVEGGAVGVTGFPAGLDAIPPDADDDEMVELAIALSLQEQVSGVGVSSGAIGVAGSGAHYADVAAMAGASDDDEGSTAATDGSTLRTPPAEPAGSPSASGSRSGSGSESADSIMGGDALAGSGRSSANGDHRPESTTTGARSETSSVGAPSTSLPQELEGDGEAEVEAEGECEGFEAGTDLHTLRLLLLDQLVQEMPQLRTFNGVRAIPYLQVILMLTSDLDSEEPKDRAALERLLLAALAELGPRNTQVASEAVTRTPHHEVQLVLMRLLSVMMSRPKSSAGGSKSESQESFLSSVTANALLSHGAIEFCLHILRSLLEHWKQQQAQDSAQTANGAAAPSSPSVSAPGSAPSRGTGSNACSTTLKRHAPYPPPNMSPFFLRQYVKGHADDVFEAFPQLLTEMALRLPYQMKKITDAAAPAFDHAWYYLLCEYMAIPQAPFVRKQVRKLLLFLCGSKERYRQLRDTCSLESGLREVRTLCVPVLSQSETQLPYDALLSLVEHLRACAEVATGRTANWQQFCERDDSVLPFLIRISPLLDDGVAAVVLQLLQAAICPKTKDNASDILLARLIHRLVDPTLLVDFARAFLLESATSSVRWQAHALMAGMFEHSSDEQRAKLLEMLWHLWPSVPAFVGKAAQFVDLLGHFAIHVPLDASVSREHAERAIGLLRSQNKSLSLHPNSGLYAALQVLVELDGYYLEAEPCLVCSDLEVPFTNVKLSALKVDSCFTTTTQVVKLIGGHLISRITLRVGDLKRAKMVRTINIYYSQRSSPAVVELKNRPSLWQKARRCSLAAGQTELKVDFPLPITACNLIIEYADFYENAQASSESLQCPRCSTSVPANPGVCTNCGENVFQCHKCRAINYDEKDPFLCNFCGFCKYAKFDFTLTARPCCAVDPIENEDDRKKAVLTINTLLEKADRVYRQLSAHKPALEALFRRVIDHSAEVTAAELGAPVSTQNATVAPAAITSPSVNRTVLHLAQRYCGDCKSAYEELTKMIQKVLACRRQLVEYDRRHGCRPGQLVTRQNFPGSSREAKTSCYGCAIAAIEHCVTLLRALAINPKTRAILCELGLVRELAENNLRRGSLQVCTDVRMLLCLLVQDNPNATDELNTLITDKVRTAVRGRLPGPDLASAVHQEMTLLATSTKKYDTCWERRLRCVVRLFILGVNSRDPVVMEAITLPCLRILQAQVQPPIPVSKKNKERAAEHAANISSADIRLDFRKWLAGDPAHSYQRWKQLSPKRLAEPDAEGKRKEKGSGARILFLSEKYGRRWLQKVHRADVQKVKLTDCEWLRHLVFNPVSRVARQETCTMLEALCLTPARKAEVVNLLTTFLSDLSTVGENCTEFITLYHNLIKSEQWKSFVAARGLLPSLGQLVTAEIERLGELEDTTLTSNLGEGYALKLLTELLATFMEQESVRRIFKSRLVGTVLNGYLALCKLVIQRTKLVDDAQDKLLELLEEMTAGTEVEKETFMSVCVQTLAKYPIKDFRTPVFVFERLCSVIHPEDNEVGEFFVTLEKDPQQEDFLQGRMLSNPYSCLDPGMGPLMRDIKNKICQDCELVALLEDDNGMELLVANKIISLDLPVKEVFKKVWLVENGDGEAMRIVYRMRGLLGDATEEFIESLSPPGGEVVDNEEVYRLANCMATCGGLDTMLERLDAIDDLARGRTLLVVLLKLFGYCIKVKRNRHELMKSESRAVDIMLTKVKQMLSCDTDGTPAAQGGLSITEQLLMLMETILMEASEDPTKLHSCGSVEDIRFLLERVMTSQPQRALGASVLQRVMRVMSFLALGSSDKMDEVVAHFKAFTNLSQFDFEHGAKVDHKMECLCVLANGIEPNAFGGKLKSKMIDAGIVQDLLNYIFVHAPSSSALLGDSDEFKEFICKPALKYVLRLLTGLSRGHPPTQQLVIADCIPVIHRLEQVSSDEHVGSLAENLMEVLRENPEVAQKIEDVRKQTRAEKKRMAMAMREKQLAGLGMRTNEKGQVTAKASILKQVEELADESGLVCVICREGYKFQPVKVLCVYTYTKRTNADDSESKARKTSAYTTVSHFNVVHVDCHVSAVRLARIRDEWESAALQNCNTRCNGLLPLWGPDVPEPAFANCLARHNTYLQDCTGHRDIGFNSTMHDVKLLLLRFAYEKSFSEDSGGGGPQSNMHLLPYLLHTAIYVLNTTRLNAREETSMAAYVDMNKEKWVENCFQVEGPLYWATVALALHSQAVWMERRITHLRRLLILAHSRHVSPGGTTRLSDKAVKEYTVYKPLLIFFALINNLYTTVFKKVVTSDSLEWSVALADYIRHNDQALLEAVDKLLMQYQDELLPCTSFGEFFDVIGLLEDIPDAEFFLNETLSLVSN